MCLYDRSNYYESGYNECVHYYHRNYKEMILIYMIITPHVCIFTYTHMYVNIYIHIYTVYA